MRKLRKDSGIPREKKFACRCENCGAEFMGTVQWQRFCGKKCADAMRRACRLRAYSEKTMQKADAARTEWINPDPWGCDDEAVCGNMISM
jgi:hypothetical protein